jgi:hypothetical protein
MSRHVPLLTEVYLRAWGVDDPRVLSPLRAENQPALTWRAQAVERRAVDAGYPVLDLDGRRKAATDAAQRLEGYSFHWNNRSHHDLFQVAAYLRSQGRTGERVMFRRESLGLAEDDVLDGPAPTIFDE